MTIDLDRYISLCEKITEFVRTFPPERGRTMWGLPTIRMIATRFGIPQKQILDICEDTRDIEYNIGIRTHSGFGVFSTVGDYLVEYVGEIE
ncbi:hypothetical protein KA005_28725 [bacterium]|nr:hypothetical protein [bacterium]